MEGKNNNGNSNGEKKAMIYEETNTANSSLQEELQNNSQFLNMDAKDKFEFLFNTITKLSLDISDLKIENSNIKKDNETIKITTIPNLMKDIRKLEENNKNLTDENILVKKILSTTEKRVDALESLIIRNNINVHLFANRDSLKTILLMFSVNLNVTKIEEIKKMLEHYSCAKKFTKLVVDVLRYLDKQLNPEIFTRAGVSTNTEELSKEEKEKITKKIIFVECIHFIVCSIDNIVHSEEKEEETTDIYSKLIGSRTKEKLQESLIHFFHNPKTMDELSSLIRKLKNKLIIGQEDKKEEVNKNVINIENVDSKKDGDNQNVLNVKSNGKNSVKKKEENKDIKQEKKDNKLENENDSNSLKKEDAQDAQKKKEEDNKEKKEEGNNANKEEKDINIKKEKVAYKEKDEGNNNKIEEDAPKEKNEVKNNTKKQENTKMEKEEKEEKDNNIKKEKDSHNEKDGPKSNTNNKEAGIIKKQDIKKNIKQLLKEKGEILNVENDISKKEEKTVEKKKNLIEEIEKEKEDYQKISKVKKEETIKKEGKETHLKAEKNNGKFNSELVTNINEVPVKEKIPRENNEIKERNSLNISKNVQNINEFKEEERNEEFNDQKEENNYTFENYDSPKNTAYLKNNYYYKKLKGKNNYENEFFIQYLFNPNLKSFSNTKLAINYESFNNYLENVFNEFQSLTGLKPLDLIKKLKWIS